MKIQKIFLYLSLAFLFGCQSEVAPLGRHRGLLTDAPPLASADPIDPLDSTEIGNGGDLIQCHPEGFLFPYPIKQGWYVLDYAEDRGLRRPYLDKKTLEEYFERVRFLLSIGAPEYVESFDSFIQSVPFVSDTKRENNVPDDVERVWIAKEKNEEINDENPSYIPRNCRMRKPKFSLKLHQVVVRQEFVNKEGELRRIEYYYDESLIEKIGDKNLQISMLLLHEWLWDFYPSELAQKLRRANRRFHSSSGHQLSSLDVQVMLNLVSPLQDRPKDKSRPVSPHHR